MTPEIKDYGGEGGVYVSINGQDGQEEQSSQ